MTTSPDPLDTHAALRKLPAVDQLLQQRAITQLLDDYPRGEVLRVVRDVLDQRRTALLRGNLVLVDTPTLALDIRQQLYRRSRPRLRSVINATGVVLHTGLGRAPLAEEAVDALVDAATGYCNLELDLPSGRRGSRHDHLRDLLRELCGVEDAMVVNNNAAATFLALHTFAAGRDAIISRGQLVEIGGSYRLPDIMAAAGCNMVEVGTTNRTRIGDYERALSESTGILLRVHCSNYRIEGFTESASLAQLVELGRRHNVLVVDDLGSGLMTLDLPWPEEADDEDEDAISTDPHTWDEPSVQGSIADGADLTLFSGDKLIGGPQAGILLGRGDLIAAVKKNPLARTFRPGKLTLAALEATLRLYRDPATVVQRVPVYRMLSRTRADLEAAARALGEQFAEALPQAEITGVADFSEAGGGSLAARPFPTWVVVVRLPAPPAARIAAALRQRDVPIICRVRDDALVFDPRTLTPEDCQQIPSAVAEAVRELAED
jgi:L-seryl-tRNA(Ser) seleniumtransferase